MAERKSLEEIFGSSAGRKPIDEIFDKNDVKQNSKMDLIDSAASKAKSIRATPRFHDAQTALAKFNEFTNRAINATLFSVPGMIDPQTYSPEQSSLSPAAQKIATGIGSVVPIELGVNKAIRAVPKPFMEPEWIKNIAKTAKTAVKGKLTELGQGYSQIFKNNQAVRVGYRTIEAIPRFIREQVGLTGKLRYSLDDLWKAREAMVAEFSPTWALTTFAHHDPVDKKGMDYAVSYIAKIYGADESTLRKFADKAYQREK